jgi:uncharacterized sulfatase
VRLPGNGPKLKIDIRVRFRTFLPMLRLLVFFAVLLPAFTPLHAAPRPNILWLVNEDHGPHAGCYGDAFATTPTFDALAAKGLRYARCWSNAPVCAPSRTTLICGLYAASTGGEHMRSGVPFPAGKKAYPQLLREAGYYCTNNAKEDYNLRFPEKIWDASSKQAHWKNCPPGVPFMAVFNSEKSHESQIRKRPHTAVHDPAKVRVPAYHPDTPEVRRDWAQYYDGVSAADADAGARLRELAEAGLEDETIVFYFSDHGSGMPGNKRWPYHRGLHVPLIIYIPEKFAALRPPEYRAGGVTERLVSFVDFAPTLCSLAGVKPPEWLQGRAFLGPFATEPQPFLFGFRGRMDERIDCVRSATDGRFVYVRNFRPDKIYGQHLAYMWETPTTAVWERMFREGRLDDAQSAFWKTKPPEELYDLANDRDEVRNLAASPEHRAVLEKLRAALREHQAAIRDAGLLPEGEMHLLCAGASPYDFARDGAKFSFARIAATADVASRLDPAATPELVAALGDPDSGVRCWAALGLLMRGASAIGSARAALEKALDDESPDVRITAAEMLARFGSDADRARALPLLAEWADWGKHGVFPAMAALNSIGATGEKATPILERVKALPAKGPSPDPRYNEYVPRLLKALQR